jgi:glycosyltransferase involved in cell wall biosynthesis
MTTPRIAVITPAHNEAERIAGLVASVRGQTVTPVRWVVVDDGSTDDTAEVVRTASGDLPWVDVIRRSADHTRSFSSKAHAVAAGRDALQDLDFDYLACLDADIRLEPTYFAEVIERFLADPALGVTGGVYAHPVGDRVVVDRPPEHHVPGPSQVFRARVFDDIGGYWPLRHGGVDTAANVAARMRGWTTRSWPDLLVTHDRRMGTGGGRHPVVAEFHKGMQDHDLGADPVFELGKLAGRLFRSPVLIGSLARLAGYVRDALRRGGPTVGREFVRFARGEQRHRMRSAVAGRLPRTRS